MKELKSIFKSASGYKTYAVAVAAVVYGIYTSNAEAVLLGLGLFGIRDGLSSEIAKTIIKKK